MPVMTKIPANPPADDSMPPGPSVVKPIRSDDGTHTLLTAGFWIVLIGLLSLAATAFLFGGIGVLGARSNAGWLALMFALMGVPFGLMLLALGVAKWLRDRRMAG